MQQSEWEQLLEALESKLAFRSLQSISLIKRWCSTN